MNCSQVLLRRRQKAIDFPEAPSIMAIAWRVPMPLYEDAIDQLTLTSITTLKLGGLPYKSRFPTHIHSGPFICQSTLRLRLYVEA
jgi:hypothetical protein